MHAITPTLHHRLTVHKVLLLLGQDAGQVATMQPTFPLCSVPRASVCHVLVALRLKLLPTKSANLRVWKEARIASITGFFSSFLGGSSHKVAWMRLSNTVHQSLIQMGKIFHNVYFYVECIHHVAHSQFLAPAVVTMNLLSVHNNFDLFIPRTGSFKPRPDRKLRFGGEIKAPCWMSSVSHSWTSLPSLLSSSLQVRL